MENPFKNEPQEVLKLRSEKERVPCGGVKRNCRYF